MASQCTHPCLHWPHLGVWCIFVLWLVREWYKNSGRVATVGQKKRTVTPLFPHNFVECWKSAVDIWAYDKVVIRYVATLLSEIFNTLLTHCSWCFIFCSTLFNFRILSLLEDIDDLCIHFNIRWNLYVSVFCPGFCVFICVTCHQSVTFNLSCVHSSYIQRAFCKV